MRHQLVNLQALRASGQPRPLVTEAVDKLASSIKEVGLIQPITVQAAVVMEGLSEAGFQIVAGHHRVAACRALGWTEIDAIVIDTTEHLQAELIEIDENLCRSELTAMQRSSHVKRRKAIWEAMHPAPLKDRTIEALVGVVESLGGATCATQKATEHKDRPQNQQQFAAETAAITGESKSQINRHVARAEALGDDLDRLVGTSLDKGVEADALIKLPEPERKELIERAVAGEIVTARTSAAPMQHPQPTEESPADFMQRYAFEMRLALDGAMCALGCKTNAELAEKVAQGIDEAEPEQLVLLDRVLFDLQAIVQMRATY